MPNTIASIRRDCMRVHLLAKAALLTAASLMTACSQETPEPPPPPLVEVAEPEVRTVTEYFFYTGTLEAVEQVEIRARVTGYLDKVHFSESTDVEATNILFTIEKKPYEIAVGQATAELRRAEAARDFAKARLAKTEEAFELNGANEIDVLQEQAALKQAEADVLAATEALEAAKLNLSYTDVKTPISGRVDRNYVDEGNLVGAQEATMLARVVALDPISVTFDVSERISLQYLSRGKDGTVDREAPTLAVGLSDETGYPHPGKVDFVDSVLDESTGTLRVRAELPNPTKKLYPGLFARIRVPWIERPDAIVVREEAVGTGLEGKFLLVLDSKNVVSRRPVELGERQEDGTVVVLEGLEQGETYIVRGLQKARPGSPVQPKPFTLPTPEKDESAEDGAQDQTSGAENTP